MSISPQVIDAMIAAGASADVLAAAWKADLAEQEAKLVEKRAKDAERQRRHRQSRHVTVTECDETLHEVAAPPPDKSPPDPQKLTPTPCVRGTRAKGGYHRLPEGWTPTRPLPSATQAKVDQWPPGALEEELAALHRWAANAKDENGKGRKLDWDKAWVNWIERRHDERYRQRTNGMGRHQPDDGLSATTRAALAVFGPTEPRHQH